MTSNGIRVLTPFILALGVAGLALLGCEAANEEEAAPSSQGTEKAVAGAGQQSEQQIIASFRRVWGERREVFRNRFLGVLTLQNPFDAWIVQEIISEVKPDFFVETGTYHGGSAMLWALILENVNPEGRVITIDIEDMREPGAINLPIARRRVDFLLGGSTDPEIVSEVARRVKGKKVVVLLDSLHTKEHVLDELKAYAPLVSPGSYIIVQDTFVGPNRAIREFLATNTSFRIDTKRERLIITNSQGGYLRRIR